MGYLTKNYQHCPNHLFLIIILFVDLMVLLYRYLIIIEAIERNKASVKVFFFTSKFPLINLLLVIPFSSFVKMWNWNVSLVVINKSKLGKAKTTVNKIRFVENMVIKVRVWSVPYVKKCHWRWYTKSIKRKQTRNSTLAG